jgi:hypothetical protein
MRSTRVNDRAEIHEDLSLKSYPVPKVKLEGGRWIGLKMSRMW